MLPRKGASLCSSVHRREAPFSWEQVGKHFRDQLPTQLSFLDALAQGGNPSAEILLLCFQSGYLNGLLITADESLFCIIFSYGAAMPMLLAPEGATLKAGCTPAS